jgi:hypothetical protein
MPRRYVPRDSYLTKEVSWEDVCHKLIGTPALARGEVSMWELLIVSPLLQKYISGLGRALPMDVGDKEASAETKAVPKAMTVVASVESIPDDQEAWALDSKLFVAEVAAINQHLPASEEDIHGGKLWPMTGTPLLLTVKTVLFDAVLCGQPIQVLVDNGSQINMVSSELFDIISSASAVPICADIKYRVSGVHGAAVPLAGCFEGDLSIGRVTTTHVFWVNRNSPADKVFLGMPFIMRNQVTSSGRAIGA